MKENTIITDWLESNGSPSIEEKVELITFKKEIERIVQKTPNDMELGKRIREIIKNYN